MNGPIVRLRRYLAMRQALPTSGIGDTIHAIHKGTEFEAECRLSDLQAALSGLLEIADAARAFLDGQSTELDYDKTKERLEFSLACCEVS